MKNNKTITYTTPADYIKIPICELMLQSPHILIGGTTGAGKSVLIDDLIYTLIAHYTPATTRLFLIDPKRVTFTKYRHLPHVEQIQTEKPAIMQLLRDAVATMENRYIKMQSAGVEKSTEKHLFIIIDEFADFMTHDDTKKEFAKLVQRLSQLGRASNIHLICATQCPAREIIPNKLTVNFGGRVALRCVNPIESRQILNRKGAENLPQYGKCIYFHCDGLYYFGEIPYMPDELNKMIKFWTNQGTNEAYFKQTLPGDIVETPATIRTRYTLLDFLRGNKLVKATPGKGRDDIETLNILSLIDDD